MSRAEDGHSADWAVSLTESALDANQALKFVSDQECGATSLFMGTTRNTETNIGDRKSRKIKGLFYEAYSEMALKLMQNIVNEGRKSGIFKCYLSHRIGFVPVGEPSIIVACSSIHRLEAHRMVLHILNQVKATVPIWKRVCSATGDEGDPSLGLNGPGAWSDKSEAFWLNT